MPRRILALVSLVALFAASLSVTGGDEPTKDEPAKDRPMKKKEVSPLDLPPGRVIFQQSATEKQIRDALAQPATIDYTGVDLEAIVADLHTRYKIPVAIDERALKADGKGPETTFHARPSADRLAMALDTLLDPHDLTYTVKNDQLLITTKIAAELIRQTRIYQIHDLVWSTNGGFLGIDSVIELLTMTIEPETWREAGGTQGEIREFMSAGIVVLVITQTEQVHNQVEATLNDLRASREQSVADFQREHPVGSLMPFHGGGNLPSPVAAAPPFADPSPVPPRMEQVVEAVTANNRLAVELFRRLADPAKNGKNMIVSPLGLTTALGPLYVGSAGTTEAEFRDKLQLPPQDEFHPQMERLTAWLTAQASSRGYRVRMRTHLFVRPDEPLLASFVEVTYRAYGVTPTALAFDKDPAAAKTRIEDRIRDDFSGFLNPSGLTDAIDEDTRLAVLNTIDFRGRWAEPFSESNTRTLTFHCPWGIVQTRMMRQTTYLDYARSDGWQIVSKAYDGDQSAGRMSLVVALPDGDIRSFAQLEQGLTLAALESRLAVVKRTLVELTFPKCTFDDTHELKTALAAMGIQHAFGGDANESADFSKINGRRTLAVADIRQKAKIEFNEKETHAAAATVAIGGFGGGFAQAEVPVVVRCDRPFLFLIRDDVTGAILFIGRVVSPEPSL